MFSAGRTTGLQTGLITGRNKRKKTLDSYGNVYWIDGLFVMDRDARGGDSGGPYWVEYDFAGWRFRMVAGIHSHSTPDTNDPTDPCEEEGSDGVLPSFVLRVDEVLRGPDPGDTIEMAYVPTHARMTSKCGGTPIIFTRLGDKVAVALTAPCRVDRAISMPPRGSKASRTASRPAAPTLSLAQTRRVAMRGMVRQENVTSSGH